MTIRVPGLHFTECRTSRDRSWTGSNGSHHSCAQGILAEQSHRNQQICPFSGRFAHLSAQPEVQHEEPGYAVIRYCL